MKVPETKITAMIVDDEMPARENLKLMLEAHCPEVEVIALADGVASAKRFFAERRPELLFLDIRMPSGAEGFDLLEALQDQSFFVVFVTAFKDYALKAFKHNALHYILKPIDEKDLKTAVKRIVEMRDKAGHEPTLAQTYKEKLADLVISHPNNQTKRILISHQRGVKVVSPSDLRCLEGSGNCTLIHFRTGEEYLDTRTLKTYESLLPDYFFRVHKSYIINLKEVVEIIHGSAHTVVMTGGKQVPVSRDSKHRLLDALNDL
jgi:two-component system LytT family response regulator